MASHKVLILDGDSVVRTKLRQLLPPGNYEIAEASDGAAGLALIHQERGRIRFILLNAGLAKIGGWDLVSQLKAEPDLQNIPMVVMRSSARDAPDLSNPTYRDVEVLDKPFTRKQLKYAVKTAIKKSRASAAAGRKINQNDRLEDRLDLEVVPPLPPEPAVDTPPAPAPAATSSELETIFEQYQEQTDRSGSNLLDVDFPFADGFDLPEEFQLSADLSELPSEGEQPPFDPTSGFTRPFVRAAPPEVGASLDRYTTSEEDYAEDELPAEQDEAQWDLAFNLELGDLAALETEGGEPAPLEIVLDPEELEAVSPEPPHFVNAGIMPAPPMGEFWEDEPLADLPPTLSPLESEPAPEPMAMPEFDPEAIAAEPLENLLDQALANSDEDLSAFLTTTALHPPSANSLPWPQEETLSSEPPFDPPFALDGADGVDPFVVPLEDVFAAPPAPPADAMAAQPLDFLEDAFSLTDAAHPDPPEDQPISFNPNAFWGTDLTPTAPPALVPEPTPEPDFDPFGFAEDPEPTPEAEPLHLEEERTEDAMGDNAPIADLAAAVDFADPAFDLGLGNFSDADLDFDLDVSHWSGMTHDPPSNEPNPFTDTDPHPFFSDTETIEDDLPPEESENTVLADKRQVHSQPEQRFSPPAFPPEEGENTVLADKRNPNPEAEPEYTVLEDKQAVNLDDFPRFSFADPHPKPTLLQEGMVTLLGFEEVQMRFESTLEAERIAALRDAIHYGDPGYQLIFKAIREETAGVQQAAEQLVIEHFRKAQYARPVAQQAWLEMECLTVMTGHSHWVQTVAIAPDNRTLISGSKDSTIKTWDLLTGRQNGTITGHESSVLSIALSPEGDKIISSSTDNTIRIWELQSGNLLQTIAGDAHHKIYVVALSPDGKLIISASADQTAKPQFESGLEGLLSYIPSKTTSPILSLIQFFRRSREIKLWDLPSGRVKGSLLGYSKGVTDLAITPKGDKVVSGSRDHTVKVWDLQTQRTLNTLWGHTDEIRSVVISPNGQHIISGSRDRTIKIWDLRTGHVLRTLRGHSQSVTSLALSPDGKTIVSGSRDATLRIWDFETGEHLNTLMGHSDLVRSVALSHDGKTIVSGSRDNTIRVWASR